MTTSNWAVVGYGFRPTDEELVNHFLKLKMKGGYDHEVSTIAEVNVCHFEPWELPGRSAIQSSDPVCHFFSPRRKKYPNSKRADRTTKAGYWKVTGKDRIIKAKRTGEHIATKKSLVFYKGRFPKGVKTNWIMHEYNPTNFNFRSQRDFVLYKLKKDPDDDHVPTIFDGEGETVTSNNVEEEEYCDQLQAQLRSFHGFDEAEYDLISALQ